MEALSGSGGRRHASIRGDLGWLSSEVCSGGSIFVGLTTDGTDFRWDAMASVEPDDSATAEPSSVCLAPIAALGRKWPTAGSASQRPPGNQPWPDGSQRARQRDRGHVSFSFHRNVRESCFSCVWWRLSVRRAECRVTPWFGLPGCLLSGIALFGPTHQPKSLSKTIEESPTSESKKPIDDGTIK